MSGVRLDQTVRAQRVAEVNAGILPGLGAVADVPAGLPRSWMIRPSRKEGARAMAAEIAALPDVSECRPILARLASKRSKRDPGDD
jgi:hypothetical protein